MKHWHLVYTKPNKESLVNDQLNSKSIETYFPYLQVERGYRRGIRLEPFFPNYLFFHVDLHTKEANGIRWLPGVCTIVHTEDTPAVVPDAIINALWKRLDPYTHHVYDRSHIYHPGQELIVDGGPFDGFEAIFREGLTGRDRAQVMLKLVDKWTKAEIAYNYLKPRDQAAVEVS